MLESLQIDRVGSFILVLARVAGFVESAPVLGARTTPRPVKILMALLLSLMIYLSMGGGSFVPKTLAHFAFYVLGQALVGLLMGTVVSFLFAAIQGGGSLADLQIGFSMSSLVDPQTGVMSTVVSRWLYMAATILFIGLDGHHWLILGLINSFKVLPADSLAMKAGISQLMIRSFSDNLKIAFITAAPVLVAVILVDVAAGFIARTAPKLNILIISFPFKIGLGLVVLMLSFGTLVYMMARWFNQWQVPIMRAFYI